MFKSSTSGFPSQKVVALQMVMVICGFSLMATRGKTRPTQRAPDLKRETPNLIVNLIPPFQAGNANRWADRR